MNPQNITIEECSAQLSSDEQQKACEFVFPHSRKQYIICRYSLRKILSYYLNVQPTKIEFVYNAYGKPSIKNKELEFNLSYRNEHSLLAVTRQSVIGIDIEHMSHELDLFPMARIIFSPSEYQDFLSLDDHSKYQAFYQAWTCKEAFTKCLGWGLSFDVKCCQVNLKSPNKIELLSITYPQLTAENYQAYNVKTDMSDYIAVAVAQGDLKEPRYFNFQP
ncbi:MAG: 4'-phosphopantetheinyl transferase superfamily protein [Chlamydiales bacterium]|nr:4'-phosphopantetheinyl transferase superfamily protein [Chlamydiales bacterium]